ncbi:MAG: hypothetical protein ACPG4T_05535 [Nannocystaceae bacterium]
MACSRFTKLATASLAMLLTTSLSACGDRETTSTATESETGTTDTSDDSETSTTGTTAGPETETETDSETTEDPTTTTGQDFLTSSSDTDTDPTTMGNEGLPNGSECMADSECESMNCYVIPMILGVCSECNEDSDCPEDKASCTLDPLSMQAKCIPPGIGTNCESDATCMAGGEELYCEGLIPILDLFLPKSCGECRDDNECTDGQLCNPNLDTTTFSGYKECVDPGSVANDSFCSGNDDVCASGHCNATDLEGLPIPVTLNICGECSSDADCMGGTCVPGSLSMGGAMGSVCQ